MPLGTVIHNIIHHIGDTGIAIRGAEGKLCAPLVSGNVCYRNMGGVLGYGLGTAVVTFLGPDTLGLPVRALPSWLRA